MRIFVLFTLLLLPLCLTAQQQYQETESPDNLLTGVYYQNGQGNNNTLNWAYPYGTKLSVIGGVYRNFELVTTHYAPYGDLNLRQWDPVNNVWSPWRKILVQNPDGKFMVTDKFEISNPGEARQHSFLKISRGSEGKDRALVSYGDDGVDKWHVGLIYGGGWLTPDFYVSQKAEYRDGNGNDIHEPEFTIKTNGNVGIGTRLPDAKLAVKGNIHAEEVKVDLSVPGPDYVFKEGYDLKPLEEVQSFIKDHGHLPNVPSAKEMEADGIQLGEMNMKLLEKIEELTLYVLKQQDQLKEQEEKLGQMEELQLTMAIQAHMIEELRKKIENLQK